MERVIISFLMLAVLIIGCGVVIGLIWRVAKWVAT